MVIVFSVLLYPLFFLLIFALAEYLMPTRNSALLFSLAMALAASGLYYLLRSRAKDKIKEKELEKVRNETLRCRAMMMDPETFASFFPKEALCDNNCEPVSESKLLAFARSHPGQKTITVCSLNGVSPRAADLAKKLRLSLTIKSTADVLSSLPEDALPALRPIPPIKQAARIKRAVRSPVFEKSARRYGVFFLFYSLLTPFRVYYRLFGLFLLGLSLVIRFERKQEEKTGNQSTKSNSRSPI